MASARCRLLMQPHTPMIAMVPTLLMVALPDIDKDTLSGNLCP